MEKLDQAGCDALINSFISSRAADEHLEELVFGLAHDRTALPSTAIQVCERAVEVAGNEPGDIRTSWAAASRDIITIVLQIYRQGDPQVRGRCLDVIDRLSELGVFGLAEALDSER